MHRRRSELLRRPVWGKLRGVARRVGEPPPLRGGSCEERPPAADLLVSSARALRRIRPPPAPAPAVPRGGVPAVPRGGAPSRLHQSPHARLSAEEEAAGVGQGAAGVGEEDIGGDERRVSCSGAGEELSR